MPDVLAVPSLWHQLCSTVRQSAERSVIACQPDVADGIRREAEAFCRQPAPNDHREFSQRQSAFIRLQSAWSERLIDEFQRQAGSWGQGD